MKLFAFYSVTDFVVPIGYRGDVIRDYFLNYEARTNDFTIRLGHTHEIEYHNSHLETGWRVTVVDTGAETPTGGRVQADRRVRATASASSRPTATGSPTSTSTSCSRSTRATASWRR